jgi:hypothetical protein
MRLANLPEAGFTGDMDAPNKERPVLPAFLYWAFFAFSDQSEDFEFAVHCGF